MADSYQVSQAMRDWPEDEFVNGYTRYCVSLPVSLCPDCGEVWSPGRLLPFPCPPEIREEMEAVREDYTVMPFDKFDAYRQRWEAVLRRHGHELTLLPGAAFPPELWRVPARPRYDFFWPGSQEMIVSERVARLLTEHQVSGISLRPVVLDKVGRAEPTDPAEVPKTGDMYEYFDEFPLLEDPGECGRFYAVNVLARTAPRVPEDGVRLVAECSHCGRRTTEELIPYKRQVAYYRKKRILPRRYVLDVDVFWSHVFNSTYVISERFRSLLADEHLENCSLTQVTVVDDGE